ncbi:hypothetical protein CVT26_012842 [Gymnopilus dilepis]|uniref:Uncharacterized protein n=1 Tax=Gymnopilus dilepis TaxID=231916 RepID=A0A409Y422_9AGAR|nr:hypothetical protein CVT26_012842 [Gymnopilus dilepis]
MSNFGHLDTLIVISRISVGGVGDSGAGVKCVCTSGNFLHLVRYFSIRSAASSSAKHRACADGKAFEVASVGRGEIEDPEEVGDCDEEPASACCLFGGYGRVDCSIDTDDGEDACEGREDCYLFSECWTRVVLVHAGADDDLEYEEGDPGLNYNCKP